MKYTIDQLLTRSDLTANDFLFFWGHKPSEDGSIIKTCLSQWWPQKFSEDGTVYHTAEQYMMAGKARLFGDTRILEKILAETSPKVVKKLGREIARFDSATWDQHKFDLVCRGNYLKFSQNAELKKFLLATGNKIIVEASPRDRIWGIGMSENHADAANPAGWGGGNLLGFALMEVRDRIQNEQP